MERNVNCINTRYGYFIGVNPSVITHIIQAFQVKQTIGGNEEVIFSIKCFLKISFDK